MLKKRILCENLRKGVRAEKKVGGKPNATSSFLGPLVNGIRRRCALQTSPPPTAWLHTLGSKTSAIRWGKNEKKRTRGQGEVWREGPIEKSRRTWDAEKLPGGRDARTPRRPLLPGRAWIQRACAPKQPGCGTATKREGATS